MLDDRKAETRSADLLGMALVYAVEALEDPLLIRLRDADAGIRNREDRLLIGAGHLHFDGAVVIVIFDRVVAEIKEHFLDNDRNALHRCAVTLQLHRDAACICGGAELLQNGIRNLIEIERENLLGKALVIEPRKPDDILDQRDHAGGFVTDAPCKAADVLLLDHAGFHHIRNAVDRGQRCFQLMRDI